MDIGLYRRFLEEYIQEAYDGSDGTPAGITEHLRSIKPPGRFTRSRGERQATLRSRSTPSKSTVTGRWRSSYPI